MHRFFINLNLSTDETISLTDDIRRHLSVLRLKVATAIILFNGSGTEYLATITELTKRSAKAVVTKMLHTTSKHEPKVHLLLCLINNDKMDLAIQKAVELGVDHITPLISERSQHINTDRIEQRISHWRKVAISSCEQCGNNYLPLIDYPQPLSAIVDSTLESLKLILTQHSSSSYQNTADKKDINPIKQVQLLVGPEGGFSINELDYAHKAGFTALKLGDLILRSETAVIAGLTYIQIHYGNFNS